MCSLGSKSSSPSLLSKLRKRILINRRSRSKSTGTFALLGLTFMQNPRFRPRSSSRPSGSWVSGRQRFQIFAFLIGRGRFMVPSLLIKFLMLVRMVRRGSAIKLKRVRQISSSWCWVRARSSCRLRQQFWFNWLVLFVLSMNLLLNLCFVFLKVFRETDALLGSLKRTVV